ncbi:MAG: VWA domain-containing protein [Vicinamibacteraceae bacterium]
MRRRDTRFARMCTVATMTAAMALQPATLTVAVAQTPSFRAAIDVVSVTAVVRDSRGRPVNNLGQEDFQIYERGRLRQIVQFKASDQGPISLGILFDVSGSMRGATQMQAGQRAVEQILSWVNPAQDEVGLFSFDSELRKEVDFTTDLNKVKVAVNNLTAIGQTSLYDAINKTAAALGDRPSPRRAVIVITDGIDTSSKLTPAQVSGMASAIDVPVYVIAVLSPLDHPGQDHAVVGAESSPVATHLSNLSYWTGGTLFMVSTPAHASQAARDLITELRHQYLIAFEAAREPGWYELDVRTRRRELTVRARSGYFSQSRQG